MRATRTNDTALIVAAQAGDRRALDDLMTAHLPLVYTITRRALGGHPDVDDVVQDVMLRALRRLRELRAPESFRAWLAAIAVHQISTYLHREHMTGEQAAPIDEVVGSPDPGAEVEGLALLRVELSGQRRQVVRASRWLDPDDRVLLPLWWLELAGQLSRAELAAALGVSVAHAGVRVQRMRTQLEVSRSVVAALGTRPICAKFHAIVADWDGAPGPLWRKRIARHTRACPACAGAADGMVATERLLAGVGLLAVPAAVTAALVGKGTLAATAVGTGVGVKVRLVGQLVQAVVAHPVVAAVAAGALAAGAVITTTNLPPSDPPASSLISGSTTRPTVAPSASVRGPSGTSTGAGHLRLGRVSLESVNAPGRYAATDAGLGILFTVDAESNSGIRAAATLEVTQGLADPTCYSLRVPDGRFLRHLSWRLRLERDEGTQQFRGDATFCVRPGAANDSVSLESSNYPGWFLRHRGDELWVDQSDGSAVFHADSSFLVQSPLTA